jgi:glucokinase
MDSDFILAIDIGGTKIAAALVDAQGGIHNRQECSTLAQEGRDAILGRLEALGRAVLRGHPGALRAVGAASAGQIDMQSGQVHYATENLPGWMGLPLTRTLEAMFGVPAFAVNDVHAMGLAELHAGAGRGCRDLFCAMVGTGIGGALVCNGELYSGEHGGAGTFGHISIQAYGGRPCNCGGTGCVEVYASSRAVVQDLAAAAGAVEILRRTGKTPENLSIHDVGAAFKDPDSRDWSALHRVVEAAADALGAGLASAVNLLAPELVVVGGSIQLLGDAYLEMVRRSLVRRAMVPRQAVRLVYSTLGENTALIGAAILARQGLEKS